MRKQSIPNFPDYLITDDGRVYSEKTRKYLKPNRNQSGSVFFILNNKGKKLTITLSKLVAQTFVENQDPRNNDTVYHIDGNQRNNHYKNLQWATFQEAINQTRALKPATDIQYYSTAEVIHEFIKNKWDEKAIREIFPFVTDEDLKYLAKSPDDYFNWRSELAESDYLKGET